MLSINLSSFEISLIAGIFVLFLNFLKILTVELHQNEGFKILPIFGISFTIGGYFSLIFLVLTTMTSQKVMIEDLFLATFCVVTLCFIVNGIRSLVHFKQTIKASHSLKSN